MKRLPATLRWIVVVLLILTGSLAVMGLWIYLTLPDVSPLVGNNPETTALMEQRKEEAAAAGRELRIRQRWIRFSDIPELLKNSVRISEDASFYLHEGVDFYELKESIRKNWEEGRFARGASTITQQLAKNLYLSTEKSILRKIREYLIAQRLEKTLSKDRIFHLYLNIIEFGPGVFGVEAAARYYYGKHAAGLSPEEMVRLTAVIPRPLEIRPNGSSRWLMWRCCWIVRKLKQYGYIDLLLFLPLESSFC